MTSFIDDLLRDLRTPTKRKARTKRALGADAPEPGTGEEDELSAWLARIALEAQWRTEARVVRFKTQTCRQCGGDATTCEGIFLRQRRRDVVRHVARLRFTVPEISQYPLEVTDFDESIEFCRTCCTSELLAEHVMSGRRQLALGLVGGGAVLTKAGDKP